MSVEPVTSTESRPEAVVVTVLHERLTEAQIQRMRADVLDTAACHQATPVVLDLTRVNFMPSMSLAALVQLSNEFRNRHQQLMLAGLPPQIRDVFVVTHLDRLFEFHEDVEAALTALRPQQERGRQPR